MRMRKVIFDLYFYQTLFLVFKYDSSRYQSDVLLKVELKFTIQHIFVIQQIAILICIYIIKYIFMKVTNCYFDLNKLFIMYYFTVVEDIVIILLYTKYLCEKWT